MECAKVILWRHVQVLGCCRSWMLFPKCRYNWKVLESWSMLSCLQLTSCLWIHRWITCCSPCLTLQEGTCQCIPTVVQYKILLKIESVHFFHHIVVECVESICEANFQMWYNTYFKSSCSWSGMCCLILYTRQEGGKKEKKKKSSALWHAVFFLHATGK